MRRGVVVGSIVAVAAVVIWLWWGHPAPTATRESPAGASDHGAQTTLDLKDPLARLRWLGQRGVAARRVAGTVSMESAPVAGATVVLATAFGATHVISDASGHFDFGPQIAMTYVVSADLPHRTGAVRTIDVRDPTLHTDQLELVLHACDASVHGTIRDAGGAIAKARVTRVVDDVLSGSSAIADDAGNYELCVPIGDNELVASADGYAHVVAKLMTYGAVRHDFSLVPEAIVVGRVISSSDHSPIAGALVTLRGEDHLRTEHLTRTTVSDEAGHFSFSGVAPGRQAISATAEHAATTQPMHAIAALPPARADVVCELDATHTVAGTVTDHEKRGVPGLTVLLRRHSGTPPSAHAVTQSDGSFVLENVEPGDYTPTIVHHDLEKLPDVHVGKLDVAGLALEVDGLGSIAGRITHDGKPVEGATVSIGARRTVSDSNGHYDLRELDAGSYAVYAESRRIGSFATGSTFTLAKTETKTGVDVELSLSASIAGIVVDQNDVPVSGASLQFSLLHGSDSGSATTAENGTFLANALSGGGSYMYEVRRIGSAVCPTADGKRAHPIEVRDAQTHVTDVRIRVHVDHLTIAGHVIDAAGHPAPDIAVVATLRSRGGPVVGTSDASGAFELHDLPAGPYELTTNALGGNGKNQTVVAGRTDVVIQLGEVGRIDGTLAGFDTPPAVWASLSNGDWFSATVTGATFQVRNLPPGDYNIQATSLDSQGLAKVTVTAGQTAIVAVRGTGSGRVVGRVVDPAGHGLANLRCDVMPALEYVEKTTDASGGFAFDRVPTGEVMVACSGDSTFTEGKAAVTPDGTVNVTLTVEAPEVEAHGKSGLELEYQLGNIVLVSKVVVGGAAEHAGVLVDDILLQVDGRPVRESFDTDDAIEGHPSGTVVKLTLERADKQLTVSLTLD